MTFPYRPKNRDGRFSKLYLREKGDFFAWFLAIPRGLSAASRYRTIPDCALQPLRAPRVRAIHLKALHLEPRSHETHPSAAVLQHRQAFGEPTGDIPIPCPDERPEIFLGRVGGQSIQEPRPANRLRVLRQATLHRVLLRLHEPHRQD